MIRFRGHHLLCSLTFAGHGYSPSFEQGFRRVVERLRKNEKILIVAGPDDICAAMETCKNNHCAEERITTRDKLALEDISSLTGIPIKVGSIVTPADVFDINYREAFSTGTIRRACSDCQWSDTCDQIANAKFATSLLLR